jgi:hypothetical protein
MVDEDQSRVLRSQEVKLASVGHGGGWKSDFFRRAFAAFGASAKVFRKALEFEAHKYPHRPRLPRTTMARLIVHNAQITTLSDASPSASALAVGTDGNFSYVGNDSPALWALRGPQTVVIDAQGRRILPGLNDSHLHILRAALWYNGELRWDGVTSLKRALEMLAEQAKRTPEGQWVRVVGGWTHYQFEEKVLAFISILWPRH